MIFVVSEMLVFVELLVKELFILENDWRSGKKVKIISGTPQNFA